jgi:HEAT repeat protein
LSEEELKGEEKIKVMIEALKSHQLFVRSTATEQLTMDVLENPEFVLPLLIKEMPDPEWWAVRFGITEGIQEAAIRGLQVHDKYLTDLLVYLKDDDEEFRAKMASCLGDIKNKLAVPGLIDLLKENNDEIREKSAESLGKIRDPSATDVLLKQLQNETSDYVKIACIEALGLILENKGDFKDIQIIIDHLQHFNPTIQTNTAICLRKIRPTSSIVPLIKAMDPTRRDITPESRQEMLNSLKIFSETEILEEIKKATKDDENLYLDLLDEVLFQNPFELLSAESEQTKIKLIPKYHRLFRRIKNEIDGINGFVADVFKKLATINTLDEIETINETIPRKRSNLEKIEISTVMKYSWVKNTLYLDLKEAEANFKMGISALFELEMAVTGKADKLKSEIK